jgi:hypothetical protein
MKRGLIKMEKDDLKERERAEANGEMVEGIF